MLKQTLKKHLINLRGPRITEKLVIFESDDWGSIRIPSPQVRQELLNRNLIKEADPFSRYDTLETAEDYYALYEVLAHFKDKDGSHPVLTANVIMNNPDFNRIAADDFTVYYNESFQQTYKRLSQGGNTSSALQEGLTQGMVYPQFHGSEHLNVTRWMRFLRHGDERYRFAFEKECFSIDEVSAGNRRGNLMAAYDYDSEEELDYIRRSISSGLDQFEKIFKMKSGTTVAPCYVWDPEVEKVFESKGVKGFQGSYQQNCPVMGQSFKKKYRYTGQKNAARQHYLVRNGLFEPSLAPGADWASKCMESIDVAFKWGKPAIIGTHRINFVAGLSAENRRNTLKQLEQLLQRMLTKWPEIRFVTSEQLLEKYS